MFKRYKFLAMVLLCLGIFSNREIYSPKKSNKFFTKGRKRTLEKRYIYGEFPQNIIPVSEERTNKIMDAVNGLPTFTLYNFHKQFRIFRYISGEGGYENIRQHLNNILNLFHSNIRHTYAYTFHRNDLLPSQNDIGDMFSFDPLCTDDILRFYTFKFFNLRNFQTLRVAHYKPFHFPRFVEGFPYIPTKEELIEEILYEVEDVKSKQIKISQQLWKNYQQKMFLYINVMLNILSTLDEGLNFSKSNPYFVYFSQNDLSSLSLEKIIGILENWKQNLKNLQNTDNTMDVQKKQYLCDFKYMLYKSIEELSTLDFEDIYKTNAFGKFFESYLYNIVSYFRKIGEIDSIFGETD